MKLRIRKNEDGTRTMIASPTRPGEARTEAKYHVKREEVEATIAAMVNKMKPQPGPQG